MTSDVFARLQQSLLDLDMDGTMAYVRAIIDEADSASAQDAVNAIGEALELVGRRFQKGEWFVGELVYSGEIAKAALELLSPLLAAGATRRPGTVLVGTVAGDMHDLGKNIFITYARSTGFDVVDLGVDVPAEKFVGAVKEHRPLALGMSCLLTVTAAEVGKVTEALDRHDLRHPLRVIVGGAALTDRFARDVGADAFAPDAVTGTNIIKGWSG